MNNRIICIGLLFAAALLFGCQQNSTSTSTPQSAAPAPAQPTAAGNITGTVVETMNALGYTYVLVDSGSEKVWAATAQFAVSEGDMVVIPEGMPMHNYHSATLNRDFEVVYFVESILNASSAMASNAAAPQGQMPAGHPPISGMSASAPLDSVDIDKLDGGMNIEEIYAARSELADREIQLRGKVVKFSPQIMGTNWVHLQDGSGNPEAGTHDLTLTSSNQLKVGDVIVVSGKVTLDKDFGHGYFYDLIMENAVVTVE